MAAGFGFMTLGVCLPRRWRQAPADGREDQIPEWYPWGFQVWRGSLRAVAIGPVWGALTAAWGLCRITDADAGLTDGVLLANCFVLFPGIVLFNRPKFLVPPRLR